MSDIKSAPISFNLVKKNSFIADEFVEQDYPTLIMDVLVFVQGVEVSDYVTGSVSITLSDRDGPNTATISLDNADDRWILTSENLAGQWRLGNPNVPTGLTQYSELPKKQIYDYKNDPVRNPTYQSPIDVGQKVGFWNSRPSRNRVDKRVPKKGDPIPDPLEGNTTSTVSERRWPLNPRSVIFTKNDPVRIFFKNPLTEGDEWFYGFTGYIDTANVSTSYAMPSSTVQLTCYDIKALMMKMRVQMNPVLGIVVPEPLFIDPENFFADLIVPTNLSHPFTNLPFEEAIKLLITGPNGISVENQKGNRVRVRGVGQFEVGKTVIYPGVLENTDVPSTAAVQILDQWHALGIVGSHADPTKIAAADFLTKAQCVAIGKGTTSDGVTINGTQTSYAPHMGKIHFLLPPDGTGARNLTQYSFEAGTEQRDWSSRYDVVRDFCANLDYQWLVAPNGDMLFEFPMYDFVPSDFGQWESVFTFDKHLIDASYSDETGDVPTGIVVSGGFQFTTAAPNLPQGLMPRAMIAAPILASRVGVNIEQHQLNFVSSSKRLKVLAKIEFQKRLAASSSLDFNFIFRPFLLPNRPVLNDVEKRMGLISSVTQSMTLFQDGNTNINLRYVRTVRSDGTYRLLTGSAHMPVSYRKIFSSSEEGNKHTAVVSSPATQEP